MGKRGNGKQKRACRTFPSFFAFSPFIHFTFSPSFHMIASPLSPAPSDACGSPHCVRLHGHTLRDARCRESARFVVLHGANGDVGVLAVQPCRPRSLRPPIRTVASHQRAETRARQSVCLSGDTGDSGRESPGPSLTRDSTPLGVAPDDAGSLCSIAVTRGGSLLVSCQRRRSLRRSWAR